MREFGLCSSATNSSSPNLGGSMLEDAEPFRLWTTPKLGSRCPFSSLFPPSFNALRRGKTNGRRKGHQIFTPISNINVLPLPSSLFPLPTTLCSSQNLSPHHYHHHLHVWFSTFGHPQKRAPVTPIPIHPLAFSQGIWMVGDPSAAQPVGPRTPPLESSLASKLSLLRRFPMMPGESH